MNTPLALLPALLIGLCMSGCVKQKDRSKLLQGVATYEVRLEPEHTNYPDMTMRVPKRFVVEWTEEATHDKFFIYNPHDTSEVQHGMIVIDVTPYPPKQIPDTAKYERSGGSIAGHNVQWRERTLVEPDSSTLYQREVVMKEIFESMEKMGKGGYVMHAFVVGSDLDLVEQLTAAVETMQVIPSQPNL